MAVPPAPKNYSKNARDKPLASPSSGKATRGSERTLAKHSGPKSGGLDRTDDQEDPAMLRKGIEHLRHDVVEKTGTFPDKSIQTRMGTAGGKSVDRRED